MRRASDDHIQGGAAFGRSCFCVEKHRRGGGAGFYAIGHLLAGHSPDEITGHNNVMHLRIKPRQSLLPGGSRIHRVAQVAEEPFGCQPTGMLLLHQKDGFQGLRD